MRRLGQEKPQMDADSQRVQEFGEAAVGMAKPRADRTPRPAINPRSSAFLCGSAK